MAEDDYDPRNIYACFVSFNMRSGDSFNAYTQKIPVLNSSGKSNRKYNRKLVEALKDIEK